MPTCKHARLSLFVLGVLSVSTALHAQLLVDCSGSNPDEYPSINAALQNAGPGATILVTGVCSENVTLQGQSGLNLGAPYGETATLKGALSIQSSENIYLYGLHVTGSTIDGITVSDSRAVFLDTTSSNGNTLNGLRVQGLSDVSILSSGEFNNNGSSGIWANTNSVMWLNGWSGPVEVSHNALEGIDCEQATCGTLGNTRLRHNGAPSGFGVDLVAGASMEFASYYGPNVVEDNTSGGISLQERSRLSIFGNNLSIIRNNGPLGVTIGFESQLTSFFAQITGHTSAGVDVYANSQVYLPGTNTIAENGSESDASSAGIRVDGNSEVFLRGSTIKRNTGPGLLVLVNSSADFAGVSFGSNTGGTITCDSTGVMVSDLTHPEKRVVHCSTPHSLPARTLEKIEPRAPDLSWQKALHEKYRKLATRR